ncbi:MAG: hypothetical protein BWY87_01528 [Deltaproteobacteria bacterium ADurb.Bin510]|nr:MAG: hypothetical protein BWY87_01528 [Deltaproteobacteria bacterium ADurb.Bin510]
MNARACKIMIVLALGLLSLGAAESTPDFREASWGMSQHQVRKTERIKPAVQDRESLIYKDASLANLLTDIVYHFVDGRLVEGQYVITHRHWERSGYIEAYENLKNLLSQKYGEPVIDEARWSNHQFEHSESQWGLAVAMGHLSYTCAWQTERTTIGMKLWGDDLEICHEITYRERGVEIPAKGDKQILKQL